MDLTGLFLFFNFELTPATTLISRKAELYSFQSYPLSASWTAVQAVFFFNEWLIKRNTELVFHGKVCRPPSFAVSGVRWASVWRLTNNTRKMGYVGFFIVFFTRTELTHEYSCIPNKS